MIDRLFEICFTLLGRVLFPRRQAWQQRRDAKILSGVIFFSLMLGTVVMTMIKMIYFKTKASL
jgi:hypothetical protein